MNVEVLEHHPCKKPVIPTVEKEHSETRRNWYGKKYQHVWTTKVYVYTSVKWTCSCGAEWEWRGLSDSGFWLCNYRPERWKKVDI